MPLYDQKSINFWLAVMVYSVAVPIKNQHTSYRQRTMTKPITQEQRRQLNDFLIDVERRAFAIAQLATSHSEEALEIVQEAMLKLTQQYHHKAADEWGPLFHRILQNKIRDWYRRNSIKNKIFAWFSHTEDEDEMNGNRIEQNPAPDNQGPDRQVESECGNQQLASALKSLSLRQQQTFILRAWEGMDVKETAYAMSCSEGSVKTHYSRAIHALRDLLKEWDHHEA